MMNPISRRNFIKNSAVTAGSVAIGTGMLNLSGLSGRPAFAGAVTPAFLESSCGSGGKNLLVTYESYSGSTSGVAAHIADTLCRKGARVDLLKIEHAGDLQAYDGVIIGSAVKSASWRPAAIDFVARNQTDLARLPVAYFLTCIALYCDTPEAEKTAQSYFKPILEKVPRVKPKAIQAFAGALDYSKMNMIVRMVMKSKMEEKGIPEGDYRNFEKIGRWTEEQVWPAMETV